MLLSWVTWVFKTYRMKAAGPLPGPRAGAATDPRLQLVLLATAPEPLGAAGRGHTPLAQGSREPLGHSVSDWTLEERVPTP